MSHVSPKTPDSEAERFLKEIRHELDLIDAAFMPTSVEHGGGIFSGPLDWGHVGDLHRILASLQTARNLALGQSDDGSHADRAVAEFYENEQARVDASEIAETGCRL